MGEKGSKQIAISSTNAATTTTASSGTIHSTQRIVENFSVVWVDANIDQSSKDCQNTLADLHKVVNEVNIFTQPDQCIQFRDGIKSEKVIVITSGSFGEHFVPNIYALPQLDAIYIFCHNKSRHEQWTKAWDKIKGIHTQIAPICEALQLVVKEGVCNVNLNQLEPSFMYTQIFKEIILEMKYDEKSIKDLAIYCRKFYNDSKPQLNIIDEFANNYRSKSPIWWYTRECFTYQMLNRALRTLEGDTIISMGFFIRQLRQQIQQLHQRQLSTYREKSFIVYRG
jgi:hypothetical protein